MGGLYVTEETWTSSSLSVLLTPPICSQTVNLQNQSTGWTMTGAVKGACRSHGKQLATLGPLCCYRTPVNGMKFVEVMPDISDSLRPVQILQAAFNWVNTTWAVADVRCRHQGCCKGVACNNIVLQTNLQLLNHISPGLDLKGW